MFPPPPPVIKLILLLPPPSDHVNPFAFPPVIKFILLLSPSDQVNPFAYSCSLTLYISYTDGILDQRGESCQNAEKQITIKAH